MKQIISFFVLYFLYICSYGQIVCIWCFDQNPAIANPTVDYVQNGSFETGTCFTGEMTCPAAGSTCTIDNWVCTDGGTSTYSQLFGPSATVIPDGIQSVYFGNFFCNACNSSPDDTSCVVRMAECELSGFPSGYPQNTSSFGGNNGVSLSQTVSGLTIGNAYILEFWAGGEEASAFPKDGMFGIDIGFGYNLFRCHGTSVFGPETTGTRYLIEFLATSTSHTIKFTNWGHICSACTEIVLDDVKLYNLNELPASVEPCYIPAPQDTLKIPNVFTPNDDGANDEFTVYYTGSKTYKLYIYNRWGEEVFISNDKNSYWKGKINNAEASEGTYFYVLYIGETETHHGFLTLLR